IHQIFYNEQTRAAVEEAAIPFDNSREVTPSLFEYGVFRCLYEEGIAQSEVVGAVSWKFPRKAQISIAQVRQTIPANPGYDLYLYDPPAMNLMPYLIWNCWRQFEYWHGEEAIGKVVETFASLPEYADLDVRRMRTSLAINIYCNYWAGNRKAWDAYMAFVDPL